MARQLSIHHVGIQTIVKCELMGLNDLSMDLISVSGANREREKIRECGY